MKGEIDTKPIEPVQVALTFFGEKSDQKKHRPSGSSSSSGDEKDIEGLQKDLANYKVQLEAKDAAYLQLLHKLEDYKKTGNELSAQLKNSEVERDIYYEELKEASIRIDELEAKVKEMTDQVLETGKIREQLSHVLAELKAVQGEVLSMETEVVAAREEKLKALKQAEMAEQLLTRVGELNEAISFSRQVSFDAEKEFSSEKEMMQELESQLQSKSVFIDSLQLELNQTNELLTSSDKIVSDVINDLNKLGEELKDKEKENSDQAVYIVALESEINHLKQQLDNNANDEATERVKDELENEAQVEIALLKAELHKVRSKLAEADGKKRLKQEYDESSQLKTTENKYESEIVKKELENAIAKVAEFRTRAEQAVTRAEAAERAKLLLEDQLKKWREQKQRRKAALVALREESLSREFSSSSSYDNTPRNYQPLGKVLNIKF